MSRFRALARAAVAVAGLVALMSCGGSGGNGGGGGGNPQISVTVSPMQVSVPIGLVVHFSSQVHNSTNQAVTWQVNGTAGGGTDTGTIDANGVYTAPATIPGTNSGRVEITAVAQADSNAKSNTATITVTAAQGLAIGPSAVNVPAGGKTTFTATANGVAVIAKWSAIDAASPSSDAGSIDQNGNYIAPVAPPPGGQVTILAVSGTDSGTATATIQFSNASLFGPYAYSYTGADANGFLGVAGQFVADGAGNITSGVEDVEDVKGATTTNPISNGSTYSVGPDGRTSATIMTPLGTATWQITLNSNQHGLLVRFDKDASGSGTIDRQDPTKITLTAIQGNYAFGVSGQDASFRSYGIAGKFFADGSGGIPNLNHTQAVWDLNDSGTLVKDDTGLNGSYLLDGLNPGRGTLTLTSTTVGKTFNFAFYFVDNTHLKLVGIDPGPFLAGDVYEAPLGPFTAAALKGSYAFTTGGQSSSGAWGSGGVFVTSGMGGVSSGVLDVNNATQALRLNQKLTASTYTVDATLGRVDMTLTAASTSYEFAAFTTSVGSAMMLELDNHVLQASGVAYQQSSTDTPTGNFATNLRSTGIFKAGKLPIEITGTLVPGMGLTVAGTFDINNGGSTATNVPLGSSTLVVTDVNGRGTTMLKTTSPSMQFQIPYYVVSSGAILLLEVDSARVMTGTLARQF